MNGKSPFLAAIGIAEAMGPVLFDGWDANGQPVAKPWATVRTPFVKLAATSENQTQNAWAPLLEMLSGPVMDHYPGLEPLGTFVNLPRGKIEPVTSSAASIKGNKPVFAILDQALALETPIPTPDGWTTMGQVAQGDLLIGRDGVPTSVVKTTEVMDDHPCFRVRFADGTSMIASEGHRWLTRAYAAEKPKVRTTAEMVSRGARAMQVPISRPWMLPPADLGVPPYLLGLWLGNGTKGACMLTMNSIDTDEILINLKELGVEAKATTYGDRAPTISFSFRRGYQGAARPEVAKQLAALPCYHDKHIPPQYLRGSIAQRTELLRGLMDSDGYIGKDGFCTFSNTNQRLIEGTLELLRSLGQRPRAVWRSESRYTGGGIWKIHYLPRGPLVPSKLDRKVGRLRCRRPLLEWETVKAIEPVEGVPVRCVAVAAPDHLFLAGTGCHVTHNTEEWTKSNGGIRMAETMRINAAKLGGSTIESPNAFIPGMGSVAEASAEYYKAILEGRARDDGLLYDHREAPPDTDMTDRDSLLAGLSYVYGDSAQPQGWVDLNRIVAEIWDPDIDPQTARADFLNQITHASDAWLSQTEWASCADPLRVVADHDVIVLGFDGSRHRNRGVTDATALVGCRVEDGHLFLIESWEQPDGLLGDDWWVPTQEVNAVIAETFRRYHVAGFYADPAADWRSFVAEWEAAHGDRLSVKSTKDRPIEWWMGGNNTLKSVRATEQLHSAIVHKNLTHDGGSVLTRHVLNARRRPGRSGIQIAKAHPDSPHKIDAAIAAILAWQCRIDALAGGVAQSSKQRKSRVLYRF